MNFVLVVVVVAAAAVVDVQKIPHNATTDVHNLLQGYEAASH